MFNGFWENLKNTFLGYAIIFVILMIAISIFGEASSIPVFILLAIIGYIFYLSISSMIKLNRMKKVLKNSPNWKFKANRNLRTLGLTLNSIKFYPDFAPKVKVFMEDGIDYTVSFPLNDAWTWRQIKGLESRYDQTEDFDEKFGGQSTIDSVELVHYFFKYKGEPITDYYARRVFNMFQHFEYPFEAKITNKEFIITGYHNRKFTTAYLEQFLEDLEGLIEHMEKARLMQ